MQGSFINAQHMTKGMAVGGENVADNCLAIFDVIY